MRSRVLILVCAFVGGLVSAPAAIPVRPAGSGLWTFDTFPATTDWATASLPGSSADISSATELDAAVQGWSAASVTSALAIATSPIELSTVNAHAQHNSSGQCIQMRPGGVAATMLMATLRNDTGTHQFAFTVSYNFLVANPPSAVVAEQIPGWRVYFSQTGSANSWTLIPALSGGFTGPMWARVPLSWPATTMLYLLWVDDNSPANSQSEGGYVIDDFVATGNVAVDPFSGVRLQSPTSGQVFSEKTPIQLVALPTPGLGAVTNVLFYDGAQLLGSVTVPTLPASWMVTNAPLGSHSFSAVGFNAGVALTSAVVQVTVTAYRPPLSFTDLGFGSLQLSWPADATGFELQSTTELGPGQWEPVLDPGTVANGIRSVIVAPFSPARFFRLEKP